MLGLKNQGGSERDNLGDDEFHQKVSKLLSRSTNLTSHGEDRKSEAYNQAGPLIF